MNFDEIPPLKELTPPEAVMISDTFWFSVAISAIVLLILAITVIILIKKIFSKRKLEKILLPFEQALLKLLQLQQAPPAPRAAALECSLIFRRVLKEETGDKSLYETHEEFSMRSDALNSLPRDYREPVRQYLQKLSRFKYTPEESMEPSSSLIEEGLALMEHLAKAVRQETTEQLKHKKHRKPAPSGQPSPLE